MKKQRKSFRFAFMESTSLFYTELLSYLLSDVEKKIQETSNSYEKQWSLFRDTLHTAIQGGSDLPFADLLSQYQQLLLKKNTFLEKSFLEMCTLHHWKILRGLPRIYHRDNPLKSEIKKEFSDLGSLEKLGLETSSLSTYDNVTIPAGSSVCLFTYMLADGWGDFIAMQEAYAVLIHRFPQLILHCILCIPKHMLSALPHSANPNLVIIPYEKQCPLSTFPEAALQIIQNAGVILSLPTFYPDTEALQKLCPSLLCIGQYGFLESESFHPQSGNYSMGLHFLEKGVFIRQTPPQNRFDAIANKSLLRSLFGKGTPTATEIQKYQTSQEMYLAYLTSPIGGAVYLHALLEWKKNSPKNIDICTPDLRWFIEYINIQKQEKKPILQGNFGIQILEVSFQDHIHKFRLATSGKTLRIICPGVLSHEDFRNLMSLSEEFVAVRGDQSFSEAVSLGRLFFYDGAPHARYFIKDLIALAENRLSPNKSALQLFRSMNKAFLYNLPDMTGEWVEESFFQEKEPWAQIAASLAFALKNKETILGCKKLCKIICNEYSFNKTLCRLVQRAFHKSTL